MGTINDELGSWDFPWLISMDETLVLCLDHLDEARMSKRALSLGLHLKMASRALRHALEVYQMRLDQEPKSEEPIHSHPQGD